MGLIFAIAETHMQFELPPIYPVTDKPLARRASHYSILKELVRGGARLVQIRDKATPINELLPDLCRCVEFASREFVTLIVNDRCDLVLCSGAAGVHLGQNDLPPDAARSILGRGRILGFSAHSLGQVRKAVLLPIQYIGFGPLFPTSTKLDCAPASGLRSLARACRESTLPIVAIGGIGLKQVREVLQAGAASAAVISALMSAKDLAGEMRKFLETARER
jgi:thiamine-phosphate diphosphorylase